MGRICISETNTQIPQPHAFRVQSRATDYWQCHCTLLVLVLTLTYWPTANNTKQGSRVLVPQALIDQHITPNTKQTTRLSNKRSAAQNLTYAPRMNAELVTSPVL